MVTRELHRLKKLLSQKHIEYAQLSCKLEEVKDDIEELERVLRVERELSDE